MKRICKQCGKEFELSQSEINFYNSKNLSLPKRCKECREANKQSGNNTPVGRKSPSALTKLLGIVCVLLFVIVGAWSHFTDGDSANPDSSYTSNVTDGVCFCNEELLNEHYQKHGVEMGFSSAASYEAAARSVVENSDALHKTEAEDGDDVYYLESTNEFVIVSTDGYIRTYFKPDDGIEYYNRQ